MTLQLGFNIERAREQMTNYISMDETRNKFMADAIEQLLDQETRLNTLELELDNQKESRCYYQKQCNQLREALSILERKIEKKAFVVVLIDGDGAIFADELVQNSEAGGVDAAHRLREAVRQYLSEKDSELSDEDTTIVVHIWANFGGLATALHRNNSIAAKEQMFQFAEGFNRSLAEFNFVNVGKGKENADSKMRKVLEFYYNMVQCRRIFFAGCHDTGYIHDLREKQGNERAKQRIVLLETSPADTRFKQLGFPITSFNDVFRASLLDNEDKVRKALSVGNECPLRTRPNGSSTTTLATSLSMNSRAGDDRVRRSEPLNGLTMSRNGGVSITYAAVGSGTENRNVDISPTKLESRKIILCNHAQGRLDPPNGRCWSSGAQDSYNIKLSRIKPRVFCNDFYLLGGRCPLGSSCSKEHEQTLTSEEVAIHRYRARTGPCATGPTCRNFECYSGHHCPLGVNCYKGPACFFTETYHGDLHYREPEQVKPDIRWIEGREFPEKITNA